jgi:quinol monooxygenase YgiN
MSVIVTVNVSGDPGQLEAYAASNRDALEAIIARAREHGLIAHRFYGADGGRIMVIDEWPDAGSFQAFFGEAGPQIQEMMGAVGATSEPEVTFWRKLETGDEVGWDA